MNNSLPAFRLNILIFFTFLILLGCQSPQTTSSPIVNSSSFENNSIDDFNFHEKAILTYYQPEEKERAIQMLKKRCKSDKKALSCYNLAVLYLAEEKFKDAYDASVNAVSIAKDSLYLAMLQLTSFKIGKFEYLKKINPDMIEYTNAMTKCDKESLHNNCIDRFIIEQHLNAGENSPSTKNSSRKKVNFTELYYKEKQAMHQFSSIWDTSWYLKGKSMPANGELSEKITTHWRDFRKNIKTNNREMAMSSFALFKNELQMNLVNRNKTNLFESIKLSAKLLIQQDPFYKNFRQLANEL